MPTGITALLDQRLFTLGGSDVTVATALMSVLVLVGTIALSRLVPRAARRVFERRGVTSAGAVGTVTGFLHYMILLLGFAAALQTLGVDIATLFAAGAIFAVGIGFAMQNIAQNFVSGVILLTERAIKQGDILEVEGVVCRVMRMGIRATIVRTRDGSDLIVPNSVLVQSTNKNYTLGDSTCRLHATVGVTYGSDMKLVRETLQRASDAIPWRVSDQDVQVLLVEFADSSVVWEVALWIDDPWAARPRTSELNEAIWWALKDAGITIAFPQVDVHFDSAVESQLAAVGRRVQT